MTKILLASTAAAITTLSFATTSEAGWRHRNHFGFDIVVDAQRNVVDDYGDDARDCYWVRKERINRYGELVIRKVQVCD